MFSDIPPISYHLSEMFGYTDHHKEGQYHSDTIPPEPVKEKPFLSLADMIKKAEPLYDTPDLKPYVPPNDSEDEQQSDDE